MMHRAPASRSALRTIALIGGVCVVVGMDREGSAQGAPPPPPPAPTVAPAPPPPLHSAVTQGQPPPAQPPVAPPPGQQPSPQQPATNIAQPPYAAPPPPPPREEEVEEEEPRSRRARRRTTREPRPAKLDWKPGEVIPPGYEPRSGPSKKLLISGLVTAGSLYVGSSIAAYIGVFAGTTELAPLFAPVVGPFITIETASAEEAGAYLLVLNGLTQTAGLTLAILSAVVEDTWLSKLPTGLPLDDASGAPRIRANAGVAGGSFGIDF